MRLLSDRTLKPPPADHLLPLPTWLAWVLHSVCQCDRVCCACEWIGMCLHASMCVRVSVCVTFHSVWLSYICECVRDCDLVLAHMWVCGCHKHMILWAIVFFSVCLCVCVHASVHVCVNVHECITVCECVTEYVCLYVYMFHCGWVYQCVSMCGCVGTCVGGSIRGPTPHVCECTHPHRLLSFLKGL